MGASVAAIIQRLRGHRRLVLHAGRTAGTQDARTAIPDCPDELLADAISSTHQLLFPDLRTVRGLAMVGAALFFVAKIIYGVGS